MAFSYCGDTELCNMLNDLHLSVPRAHHHMCNNTSPRIWKLLHYILPDTTHPHTISTNRDDMESGLTNKVAEHEDLHDQSNDVYSTDSDTI
jgi:hypothetical protein